MQISGPSAGNPQSMLQKLGFSSSEPLAAPNDTALTCPEFRTSLTTSSNPYMVLLSLFTAAVLFLPPFNPLTPSLQLRNPWNSLFPYQNQASERERRQKVPPKAGCGLCSALSQPEPQHQT